MRNAKKMVDSIKQNFSDRKEFYRRKEAPELRERTRERLIQISEVGMIEVAIAEFGVPGVVSGLYIENVWHFTDREFKDYMDWAIGLINESKSN